MYIISGGGVAREHVGGVSRVGRGDRPERHLPLVRSAPGLYVSFSLTHTLSLSLTQPLSLTHTHAHTHTHTHGIGAAGARSDTISPGRVFMMNTRAQRQLLHIWIMLVVVKQHLVQIG